MTNNKEERLIKLIRREQANKGGNYEEICELLFDEVNNLVRPVCSSAEESRKKVKKLFVRMLQQINEIDTHDDIHLWIAGFSTVTLYEILCKEYGQIITYKSGNIDYSYSHIDEDEEFKSKIGTYNDSLANPKRYMYSKDFFSRLTKGQIIIFEMFCYEGFTIDEIEELLEIDKIYITSEISSIRQMVLGNDNEEIELIAADNKGMARNVAEEEDSDDIAAIKAAVAAIVNDTVDEVNHEEGYKDIISVVNSFNDSTDSNEDKLGATLVNINKEHINKSLKENQYNVSEDAGRKDDMSDVLLDEQAGDKQSDVKQSDVKQSDVKQSDVKQTTNKKFSDIDADYIEDDIEDEDNDTSDEADTDKSSKKKHISKLFGIEDLSQYEDDDELEIIEKEPVKKNKKNRKPDSNKILKILSIAIPSVAVVIFVVILLTSGAFKKTGTTSNTVTTAETKTTTGNQEKTTQTTESKNKSTEKTTQKTTEAKTEKTTEAKKTEATVEKADTNNNNNSLNTNAGQNNTFDNTNAATEAPMQAPAAPATEAPTQATSAPATAAPTQATAAPTQATAGNTQATEGNTQATAAPTDAPTQATSAPTQADTVVDEKNGTALH